MKIFLLLAISLYCSFTSCTPRVTQAASISITPRPRLAMATSESAYLDSSPSLLPDTIISTNEPETASLQQTDSMPEPIVRGGLLSVYSLRPGLLQTTKSLMFLPDSQPLQNMVCSLTQKNPRTIVLTLARGLSNARGNEITAYDCADALNTFIRTHPLQARGIFPFVEGLRDLQEGREAVLRGMRVIDASTITFSLSIVDTLALIRLSSPLLFPASLHLGLYYQKEIQRSLYSVNPLFVGGISCLDSIRINDKNDNNPLVGFSRGKYDLVELVFEKDIAYAKANLSNIGSVHPYKRDNYFLCLNSDMPKALRLKLLKNIRIADLIKTELRINAQPISHIFSYDSLNTVSDSAIVSQSDSLALSIVKKPLSIIAKSEDALSAKIAKSIATRISAFGIPCSISLKDEQLFEAHIATNNYSIVVGYIPQEECLLPQDIYRHSFVYFGNDIPEDVRKSDITEIPLFGVDIYALCKPFVSNISHELGKLCKNPLP